MLVIVIYKFLLLDKLLLIGLTFESVEKRSSFYYLFQNARNNVGMVVIRGNSVVMLEAKDRL